jgi:predicted metal-dependent phosphoesterase TrpH
MASPEELLALAKEKALQAIAITDHDTLDGYDRARRLGAQPGLEVLCGIELTCKLERKTAHLLGYFLSGDPEPSFRQWLIDRHEQRRDRNRRLVARLQALGIAIELHEVESLGRSMTGRPHFARVLIAKGYAESVDEAFQRYLGEDAPGFVEHEAPSLAEGIERINGAGGISSLAHMIRLSLSDETAFVRRLADSGMRALEVFHSDHGTRHAPRYLELARRHDLAVTGGSDYHGSVKPRVALGCAAVEPWVLEELRERFA